MHDPLGLELLPATIRGEVVRFEDTDQREVAGITSLQHRYRIEQRVEEANNADRNTRRIGIVTTALEVDKLRMASMATRRWTGPSPARGPVPYSRRPLRRRRC